MSTEPDISPHPEWSDAALDAEPVLSHRALHRIGWAFVIVLLVILLTVLPPLLNVNHYQRRVAQAISASIGRPVQFDQIHLHLLPLPGLTIQNFVVREDPAFGTEPALRANTVEARLRLSSLWRRRVEVSHITLQAPSINLVRRADGRWNLQGVVTEAGYLQSAPTQQGRAGPAPRFPYIEATEARINIKTGETKLPWSLLDAKLALWLPDQNEWRIRLRGRPLRTDTDVSDVGELELEGSLGRGSTGVANQPLAISAKWASTPLGEAAKLFMGRDTGFRGAASAELEVRGTPAHMTLSSDMHLHNLRRTEFVPRLPMSVDAHCEADALGIIHALHGIRCAIPTAQSAGLFQDVFRSRDQQGMASAPDVLFLQAELPDITAPHNSSVTLNLANAQPEYFLNWLRVFSSRIPEAVQAHGTVSLRAHWDGSGPNSTWMVNGLCRCALNPALPRAASPATVQQAPTGDAPWLIQVSVDSNAPVRASRPDGLANTALAIVAKQVQQTQAATPATGPGDVTSILSDLGPLDTRSDIAGNISATGVAVSYPDYDQARYAASLLPPLGDDMPAPTPGQFPGIGPIFAERVWGQPQQWTMETEAAAPAPTRHTGRTSRTPRKR
ncbi:AsmA family protein [Terriglobus sp.]|uniref:AsmA family protein n=1 Tax=Terriglobus sp. TaxID=1889013 RepID=UPI003AFFEDF5